MNETQTQQNEIKRPPFSCNCSGGETQFISDKRVIHKCGFRPSASYGSLGIWTPYVTDSRGRWWVDWQSKPKRDPICHNVGNPICKTCGE